MNLHVMIWQSCQCQRQFQCSTSASAVPQAAVQPVSHVSSVPRLLALSFLCLRQHWQGRLFLDCCACNLKSWALGTCKPQGSLCVAAQHGGTACTVHSYSVHEVQEWCETDWDLGWLLHIGWRPLRCMSAFLESTCLIRSNVCVLTLHLSPLQRSSGQHLSASTGSKIVRM